MLTELLKEFNGKSLGFVLCRIHFESLFLQQWRVAMLDQKCVSWSSCRFNCGTGAAQILSESSVVLGQWHTVTVFRDGMSGWLRLDNNTPVSGRSQVGAALGRDPIEIPRSRDSGRRLANTH